MHEATRDGLRKVLSHKKAQRHDYAYDLKTAQSSVDRNTAYLRDIDAEIEAIEADLITG